MDYLFYFRNVAVKKNNQNVLPLGLSLSTIGLVLQMCESYYYLGLGGWGLGIKFSSFIFSAGMILCLMSRKNLSIYRRSAVVCGLAWLEKVSFGVYLIHPYVIKALAHSVNHTLWIIEWGQTLFVTLMVIVLFRLILPHRLTFRYLGF